MVSVTLLQRGPTSFRVRTRWKDEASGEMRETNTTVRGTRAHAEAHRKLILDGFNTGTMTSLDNGTVAAYLEDWLKKREAFGEVRASTIATYRKMLKNFTSRFGETPLVSLTVDSVRKWVADTLAAKGAYSTCYTCKVLKKAFKTAVRDGKMPSNPFDRVDLPQMPDNTKETTISSKKLKELWEWSGSDNAAEEHAPWRALAVRLALETGLRRGELAGLQWQDVSESGVISVRRNAVLVDGDVLIHAPKSKKGNRKITVSTAMRDELNSLRPDDEELFVIGGGTEPIKPDKIARSLTSALRAVDVKGFTAHDYRHAHATHLLRKRVPLSAVSRRLGHAKVTTTMGIYAHALQEDEDVIVGAVDNLLR